jgi:hypothetical protein
MFLPLYVAALILVGTGMTVVLLFLLFIALAFSPQMQGATGSMAGALLVGPYLMAVAFALVLPGAVWSHLLVGRIQTRHRRLASLPYRAATLVLAWGIGFTAGLSLEEHKFHATQDAQASLVSYPVARAVRTCANGPLHEVDSPMGLPSEVRALLKKSGNGQQRPVPDNAGGFDTVGLMQERTPERRFVLAAANEHCAIVALRRAGHSRQLERWFYVQGKHQWSGIRDPGYPEIPQVWGALLGPDDFALFAPAIEQGDPFNAR